jgi:hypothetical protein
VRNETSRFGFEPLECRRLLSGSPAISISDVAVAEGQGGATAYVFTASLSKASLKRVSVNFATADGSAVAGEDYAQSSGTLDFARGETAKTLAVLVNGDTTVEADETFSVELQQADNAFVADSRGIGTIVNDDVLPPPVDPLPVDPAPVDPAPYEPDPSILGYGTYEDYANYLYYSGYNFNY